MRVHVIYGQFGIITSFGMNILAQRIRAAFPAAVVKTWSWSDWSPIVDDILHNPKGPVVLVGYSLGANCTTWVSSHINRLIDLAVCYDPSILAIVTQPGKNVKRLLLYHNTDIEPEGHARFVGPQVETTEISMPHLAICYSQALHAKTMAAIAKVAA